MMIKYLQSIEKYLNAHHANIILPEAQSKLGNWKKIRIHRKQERLQPTVELNRPVEVNMITKS